jgi:hypothetical protein
MTDLNEIVERIDAEIEGALVELIHQHVEGRKYRVVLDWVRTRSSAYRQLVAVGAGPWRWSSTAQSPASRYAPSVSERPPGSAGVAVEV